MSTFEPICPISSMVFFQLGSFLVQPKLDWGQMEMVQLASLSGEGQHARSLRGGGSDIQIGDPHGGLARHDGHAVIGLARRALALGVGMANVAAGRRVPELEQPSVRGAGQSKGAQSEGVDDSGAAHFEVVTLGVWVDVKK